MHKTYPKNGGQGTREQTGGSKQLKEQFLAPGQAADIHKVPPRRIYDRDYCKVDETPDTDDTDTVSPVLGNPLVW